MESSDLDKVDLIDSGDWRDLTNGTLKPLDAASRIDNDESLASGPYASQVNFIIQGANQSSNAITSRIILVGQKDGPYTVIDGVHRIVGVFLYFVVKNLKSIPFQEAYLGISKTRFTARFI